MINSIQSPNGKDRDTHKSVKAQTSDIRSTGYIVGVDNEIKKRRRNSSTNQDVRGQRF